MKYQVAKKNDTVLFGTATNVGNDYSVSLGSTLPTYVDGMGVSVKINADSTGTSTLNVNGLGAKVLKNANGNDSSGLKANGIYTFRYNATTGNFMLQGEGVDVAPLLVSLGKILES